MTYKIINYGILASLVFFMLVLSGCGDLYGEAEEMNLKETLVFGGIDADVHYTDKTVSIIYSLDAENEEDILMSVFYVFGAASEIFPYADLYRITYNADEEGDISYFYEAEPFYVKQFLKGESSLDEFRRQVTAYVR